MSTARTGLGALRVFLIFSCGFAAALYYARLGFHPLDGSIVFDAGWRIFSGQVPLRDFATPEAIVPGLMQAGLFAMGGVNWFVYCLHAALLNGAFCLVVYWILRNVEVGVGISTTYAILTGLAFQPPFGLPFPELHSFFFIGVATLALVGAARGKARLVSLACRAALPFLLALAVLSKANPAGYAVPLVVVAAVLWRRPGQSKTSQAVALLAGTFIVLAGAWTAFQLFDIDSSVAWLDLWERPRRIGSHRLPEVGIPMIARILDRGLYREGLLLPGLVSCALLAAVLAGPRFWRSLRADDPVGLQRLLLAAGLCLVGLLYRSTALNQPLTGVAFAFLAAGLLHGSLRAASVPDDLRPAIQKGGALLLSVVAGLDAVYLTTVVNPQRSVNDIQYRAELAASPNTPALSFMRYQVNTFYRTTAAQLDRVVRFIENQPENFILIGDHSILYGITGRPSVNPSLWFHDGLTAPARKSPTFAAHRRRMLDAVDEFDVGWVVVEGRRTGMYSTLDQYPGLEARIDASGCEAIEIGNFRFHRLDSPGSNGDCGPQAPSKNPAGVEP